MAAIDVCSTQKDDAMRWWDKYQIPAQPPQIDEPVKLTEHEASAAGHLVAELSETLGGTPAILSQQGQVVRASGLSREEAAAVAVAIYRVWRRDDRSVAREIIRFTAEVKRRLPIRSFLSLYVVQGLTLTVGWKDGLSLNRLRSETANARSQLLRLLRHEAGGPSQ